MKKFVNGYSGSVAFAIIVCLLLSGWSWFGGNKESEDTVTMKKRNDSENSVGSTVSLPQEQLTGQVLVTMQGSPVITVDSLQQEEQKLFDMNPQLEMILATMNKKEFEKQLVFGFVNQIIIDKSVVDMGITNKKEYQTELKESMKAVQRMINTKYFSQEFNVTVTDSEVRKFYDENKSITPELLISQGGTKAMGVLFDIKQEAEDFKVKVLAKKGDMRSAAKDAGIADDRVKDFKLVNEQSVGMIPVVKDAIVDMKNLPSVSLVTPVNGGFWVVSGTEREEPKYRPFDQIKAELKKYIEKEKHAEVFEKEIEGLKVKYDVIINEDYFISSEKSDSELELETEPLETVLNEVDTAVKSTQIV